jgi:hypothetical protein
MRRLVPIVLALSLPFSVSGEEPETSKSFAFATYKERVGPMTLLVGSFPAALASEERFIPLQVAVGIRGKDPHLTVSPESFTLIDQDGAAYPLASYREVTANQWLTDYVRQIDAAYPLVTGEQFANSERLQSRFFPPLGSRPRIERVHLVRSSYFEDLIYFPRPDLGLRGVLTLRFQADGMAEPIDVRFEIPLKGSKRDS